jgi:hypothetical protein
VGALATQANSYVPSITHWQGAVAMSAEMECSKCDRPATRQAYFLGRWVLLCRYHIGAFYDLPQRPVDQQQPTCMATIDGHSCSRRAVVRSTFPALGHPELGGLLRCRQHANQLKRDWLDSYSEGPVA